MAYYGHYIAYFGIWSIHQQPTLNTSTLWLFNIAMEHDPFIDFIDGLAIENGGSFHGELLVTVSHNQI